MKKHLLYHVIYMTKLFTLAFIAQCLTMSLLLAWNGNAQVKSIEEVKVYLSLDEVKIEKAFKELEKHTDYNFVFATREIRDLPLVTFEGDGRSLYDILADIAVQAKLNFKQVDLNIHVKKSEKQQAVTVEQAVDVTVSGTVTDQNGDPLPGVTVSVPGSTIGTATDLDGRYTLSVPEGATLVFSFIGFETQRIVIGDQHLIDLTLTEDLESLDEVVVTAFGMEREKKALTYSVQELEGESLAAVGNANITNSLQGKVAGVNVWLSSGQPGSTHNITIRGSRSITGNNAPLYVIDGLPVSGGERVIDINPSDIKSMSVLKGPTAAALYGLRASNGVILIETKKGDGNPEGVTSINFGTSYNFDMMSVFPDLQMTYAQGSGGVFDPYGAFSWGPRIDTMGVYINQLGEEEEARAYNNLKDFMQIGGTFNANLNISKSYGDGNYSISLGSADQKGIIDYSDMRRINTKVSVSHSISEKIRLGGTVNYVSNVVNERPDGPSSDWWAYFGTPPSYNLKGKPTHVPGNPYEQINFRGQHDNLYWMIKNNNREKRTSRVFGSVNLDYTPLEWLKVNYRIGIDEYMNDFKTVLEKGSGPGRTHPPSGGTITDYMNQNKKINSNLNISANANLGDDIILEILVGNEFYDTRSRSVQTSGSDIVIGGFHDVSNTKTQTANTNLSRQRVFGNYANLNMAWKSTLFLNMSGRNDIVSNMPSDNRSFFYPSIGLGFVFSEVMNENTILPFGKFRMSVAEVGQAGPLHSTKALFTSGAAVGGFSWPYDGLNAFTQSGNLNASDLRTENTRTFEIGTDLRLINNRIGIDYTYYSSISNGQIYRVPIALSTGFTSELRNAGEMSVKGHELMLNFVPIDNSNFTWRFITNFSTYRNKVLSLAEGIEELGLGGSFVNLIAKPGHEYPLLKGVGFARDPISGDITVDSREYLPNGNKNSLYGMPLRATEQLILGKAQPDFYIGFTNEFRFNNFSLSAQIDWKSGGNLSSGITGLAYAYGALESQSAQRENDFIYPGKKGYYSEGKLVIEGNNDIPIRQSADFGLNEYAIKEAFVFDASFVRLREVRLSYTMPENLLQNSFLNSAEFFLLGSNILMYSAMDNFDPEMFDTSIGEEYLSYPQIKSFGGGIQIGL